MRMHPPHGVGLDGEAENYSALPAAADHDQEVWLVLNSQGVWGVNLKRKGLWYSDGSTWERLGAIPTRTHAELDDVAANDHHNVESGESATHNHGNLYYTETEHGGVSPQGHHTVESGQSGTHTHAGHDTAHPHSDTTGRTTDDHHAESHTAAHQHGGGQEVATATPGAYAIPKAGAGGKLAAGWIQEVLAYADLTDDPYADHSGRHENTGADEINVGGLSGELADDQPPKAHKSSHAGGSDALKSHLTYSFPSDAPPGDEITTGAKVSATSSGPDNEAVVYITIHALTAGGANITVTLEQYSAEDLDTGGSWSTVKAVTCNAGHKTTIDNSPSVTITARRPLRINIGGTVAGWEDLTANYEVERQLKT